MWMNEERSMCHQGRIDNEARTNGKTIEGLIIRTKNQTIK